MILLSDIHGNFLTMQALLAKIPQSEKDKGVAIAGDLIDRGPRSKEVVQWCIDNKTPCVRGNHEEMMIIERGTPKFMGDWGPNGGYEAFNSYKDENGKPDFDLIDKHLDWMKSLPLFLEFKDVKNEKHEHLLVTHSSAAQVWNWSDQRKTEQAGLFQDHIQWGRPAVIRPIKGIFNVFGHTPVENGPKIKSCFANIDTGCFYKHSGYGVLTALQFPEMIIYQQENID